MVKIIKLAALSAAYIVILIGEFISIRFNIFIYKANAEKWSIVKYIRYDMFYIENGEGRFSLMYYGLWNIFSGIFLFIIIIPLIIFLHSKKLKTVIWVMIAGQIIFFLGMFDDNIRGGFFYLFAMSPVLIAIALAAILQISIMNNIKSAKH